MRWKQSIDFNLRIIFSLKFFTVRLRKFNLQFSHRVTWLMYSTNESLHIFFIFYHIFILKSYLYLNLYILKFWSAQDSKLHRVRLYSSVLQFIPSKTYLCNESQVHKYLLYFIEACVGNKSRRLLVEGRCLPWLGHSNFSCEVSRNCRIIKDGV